MGLLLTRERSGRLVFTIDPIDIEMLEEYVAYILGLGS